MRLIEFAKLIQLERGDGPLDRDVNGVAWDCRRVAPGNLFVAIPSVGRDTQSQIETAVERGAGAVLCEGHAVVGRRATRLQAASVRAALPRIGELFFGQPDRRLVVIGVAGSSGNAAPALLLKTILNASGLKCGHIGAAGTEIGERQLPPLRKNCEALDYLELLSQMVRAGCTACIIEFGPDAIELKKVTEIAFDTVIFGTLNADLAPGRGSALVEFCRTLANGPKRFTAAFNLDDAICKALFESKVCGQQISYGFNASADVRATNVELSHGSLGMVVAAGTTEIRLRNKLTGRTNAAHIVAACAGALACRIPLPLVRFTLQKMAVIPGSLEPVGNDDVQVYVDAGRSEFEVRRALESLREVTRGSVLLVIGSPAGESFQRRQQLGRMAASLANYTVITADNPGIEAPHDIASEIERGFAEGAAYQIELDRTQAIEDIIQMAQPGDTVLIAGKGLEHHQEFSDTIVPFDDREHAIAALEMRGTQLAKAVRAPIHVNVPLTAPAKIPAMPTRAELLEALT